jgi:hypothetical protein
MCCFKPTPQSVSETLIFASHAVRGRQVLVYSLLIEMTEPIAMILPIPVRRNPKDDDVRFTNMQHYPEFFTDLELLFPAAPKTRKAFGFGGGFGGGAVAPPLQVHEVGDYDASFVPSIRDFDRLDERFRIEESVWLTQPHYAEYGFVVFQLKTSENRDRRPGAFGYRPHPMAFDFPLSNRDQPLFFPTVHIHDGTMPDEEEFDHILYAQTSHPDGRRIMEWDESSMLIIGKVKARKAARLITENQHCYRRKITGLQKNRDTWL